MKKNKNTNSTGGLIYSTNANFTPQDDDFEEQETLPNEKQNLRVQLDKKNRGGKEVTLITGFAGTEDDLETLGKTLKNKCGSGGSVKDGEIIIQGDKRKVVGEFLLKEKYKVKVL